MDLGIGERIRAWRLALRVEQKELAKRCGLTVSAVSQWESGTTRPTLDSLEALYAAFELEPSEFWGVVPALCEDEEA